MLIWLKCNLSIFININKNIFEKKKFLKFVEMTKSKSNNYYQKKGF